MLFRSVSQSRYPAPKIVAKHGEPMRTALHKNTIVIHKKERAHLRMAISNASNNDKRYSTNLLLKNVVITHGKTPLNDRGERYLMRVRRKTYPRDIKKNADGKPIKAKGKRTTTLQTTNLLEYGSEKQMTEPWIHPAFLACARQTITTIETEMVKSVDRIIAKLFATNKKK